MASKILTDLEKEATCPICRKQLTEPLGLACGHALCPSCITVDREEAEEGSGKECSCPVCGTGSPHENLWANQHQADTVEKLGELKLNTGVEKKIAFCALHGEKLQLFCKEDQKVICWLCERSQEHCGHHTFLVEEVVQECQERVQAALQRLREEQQEAEKLKAAIMEDRIAWKHEMKTERQWIESKFCWLRRALHNEKQRELRILEEKERKTLADWEQAEDEMLQQSQVLEELISELEHRSQWAAEELLQDTSGILKWSEIWTVRKPKTPPRKTDTRLEFPDLRRVLCLYREDFTLNPVNLNLNLVLSEDHRQVRAVPIWPFKSDNYGILGSQYFSSGKHYWEVDVSNKTAWVLGVYCRKPSVKLASRLSTAHLKTWSRYKPEHGYWVIGLRKKHGYRAFDESPTFDPKVLALSVAIPLRRIGVFLSLEAGTVSFFNITDNGSLIYQFHKCCHPQPLYPYFNPGNCPAPLTLCRP
ncbi:tripartite motif-containing protein 34 isoform X2 [Octodon degus]|uniref:Tripartite motif-containing protein 34 isoform X2 n=1 Tax=Octodon degus TaxID=10160 RepID=A0A6P6DCS4_OCTDE|nr:tripartite motif-containing protein 34 isoform X2 [Octodon degus]